MAETQVAIRRFRKTAEVEAVQFTKESAEQVQRWCRAQMIEKLDGSRSLVIPSLEGDHWANLGDWVLRGVKGEFWAVRADIFPLTYEPVEAHSGGNEHG